MAQPGTPAGDTVTVEDTVEGFVEAEGTLEDIVVVPVVDIVEGNDEGATEFTEGWPVEVVVPADIAPDEAECAVDTWVVMLLEAVVLTDWLTVVLLILNWLLGVVAIADWPMVVELITNWLLRAMTRLRVDWLRTDDETLRMIHTQNISFIFFALILVVLVLDLIWL